MTEARPTVAAPVPGVQVVPVRGRRRLGWIVAAVALFALPHVPGLDGDFGRSLLSQMGIATIFALSFNMLLGQTGLLSFGHAVYFGLGGYVAVHVMRLINAGLPIPMPLVPLAGAAGGLAFGILLGSVSTRRAGTVFAMITLGLGELVAALAFMLTRFFGGEEGITANRTRGPHLAGLTLTSQLQVYDLIAVWVLISVAAMYAFTRTPVGRMCNAVRDNPERAEFVGYDPQRVRFIAFAASALFAGLAGGLHAINYEIVAAEAVGAARSGIVLLMAFIGGMGNFFGPIVGAIVITWLQVSLSDFTTAWQLYLGIFFILIVLFVPGGLASVLVMHGPLLRARLLHRLIPSYLLVLVPAAVTALGASLLLEINYRLATKPELGTRMTLYWVSMDVSRPWPWIAALGLCGLGSYGLRRTWPLVDAAWQDVMARMKTEAAR
jgi:branched-chain amino acid transport system permease protein